MAKLIDELATLPAGVRNAGLNKTAWKLGQWVAAGTLGQGEVENALYAAAERNGLVADDGQRQTWATIRSGLSAGLQQPIDLDADDLGSDQRRPTTAPVAWTPTSADPPTSQLAFVKPVPGATSNSGGLFDLFGTLRTSAPASALFVVDLNASVVQATQPRRLGKLTGVVAPVWRQDGTLLSFVRQNDGALALRAIDSGGGLDEPGAPLPVGAIQGTGLAAHWDTAHGRVLLLSRPATTNSSTASVAPLQAWLVSYLAARQVTP